MAVCSLSLPHGRVPHAVVQWIDIHPADYADVDLSLPEFTPMRRQLARAFLKHRGSMGPGAMPATNGSSRTSMMFAPCSSR